MNSQLFIFCGSLLALTSCGTIVNGRYQEVSFSSDPTDATVYVDDNILGRTPLIASLERCKPHSVKIELEGYEPYITSLRPSISGWVIGNLFTGVLGVAVDVYSGGLYKLNEDHLMACLEADNRTVLSHHQSGDDCHMVVVSKPNPTWERIGTMEHIPQ